MPNCTPVIFSAVYAFFEDRGATTGFGVVVPAFPRGEPGFTHVEVHVTLGPGGEFARVTYLVSKEDPSTYEVSVAYRIQRYPDRADIGMSREEARVFHADVALVEKMLEYVDKRVAA